MAANYLHGIETIEKMDGARPIKVVKSAVIGLIGTAPCGPVNKLTQCLSQKDAAQFGTQVSGFSIAQAFDAIYDHGAGTVLVVNVLNPEIHRSEALNEKQSFGIDNRVTLTNPGVIKVTKISVMIGALETTAIENVDYQIDMVKGVLVRIETGSIPARAEITVDYLYADPTKVTPSDIIGAVDAAGYRTGLQALADAYNLYGFFAKILIAPGFSTLKSISTELTAAAEQYGAQALIDAPVGITVNQVINGRGPLGEINFDTSSGRTILCYPHLKIYDTATNSERLEPYSQRLAGVMAKKDLDKGYWWSPSNTEIMGIIGSERPLTARVDDPNSEVNALNEAGIVTVFNSFGTGMRVWGNRTAAWPSVTHVSNFINVRRTKDIIDESIRYSSLQFVDSPVNDSLVDSVVESVNQFFAKLIGDGALLGGECWFDLSRNPTTNIEMGNLIFNYKFTIPTPFERGTFETQITGEYFVSLGE